MKKKRRHATKKKPLLLLEGNVWVMPSLQAAREVYQTLIARFLDKTPAEWSLVSGFFLKQPVLAFLWDPIRDAQMATEVARLALLAGGQVMEDEAKAELLAQLLSRRLGLQKKEPFVTLTAHHPKGKPIWDLKD
jgi:hypothetical protein